MTIYFKCPKCQQKLDLVLHQNTKSYRCENGHCFDLAKQGYVNLLLVEKKKSKNPGDDALMIKSRETFLNQGYYACLAEELAGQLNQLGCQATFNLLDIGCGEGYYLQKIVAQKTWGIAGIDISKYGVKLAARRNPTGRFAVASAFDLPFFEHEFDAAISVFSPVSVDETLRVIKPGGSLFMVGPGPRHLAQLAEKIYQKVECHKGNNVLHEHPKFKLMQSKKITENISVDNLYVLDLLRMTPYYWTATAEQQEAIASLPSLQTEIEFEINHYLIQ